MKARCALFLALCLVHTAWALIAVDSVSAYPEKPVTMICGFPAGGALDVTARAIAEAAKKDFPKGLVVVNKPGAGSTIANAEVMAAKPDGYTIGIAASAPLTVMPHNTKLPYDKPDDYAPIMNLVDSPQCWAVGGDSPWKTIEEFIDYARKKPGDVRVGTAGVGTIFHLNVEQLKKLAGIDLTFVPFQGGAEVVPALLGKHVGAACLNLAEILPQVKAGKARILAVIEEKRNPLVPDVPTFKEKGYDMTMGAYYLLFGPKGLPKDIKTRLHDTFRKAMKSPIFYDPIKARGFLIRYQGPDEITARILRDHTASAELVKKIKKAK
ncbi:MAG: tripartite tricarboxylate transporter substrate binding protein [Deltaproteobacteria bacterium]|nr:tripartite tricarboxylate transporter substrate binding protein [Deltaproteobacteria bacterium]